MENIEKIEGKEHEERGVIARESIDAVVADKNVEEKNQKELECRD